MNHDSISNRLNMQRSNLKLSLFKSYTFFSGKKMKWKFKLHAQMWYILHLLFRQYQFKDFGI